MSFNVYLGSFLGVDKDVVGAGVGASAPTVVSAISTSYKSVEVTFSTDMLSDVDYQRDAPLPIYDPRQYRLTNTVTGDPIGVLRIKKVSETVYELITTAQAAVSLELWVSPHVQDAYGNDIDDANNTATFTGGSRSYEAGNVILRTFVSGITGMQDYEELDFLPDQTPPYLQSQDPSPSQINVPATTDITLEIVDDETGIKEDSVVITVEGVTAWQNNAQQNSYTVVKSTVAQGFRYVVTPPATFSEGQVVSVGVYAEDNEIISNPLSTAYDFTCAVTAPVLQNLSPFAGESQVDASTNVYIEIVDPESGVDAASVVVVINGVTAWQNEAFANGYGGTITPIANGYSYDLDPPDPFPGGGNTVQVDADNLAETPASLSTSYGFTVFLDLSNPVIGITEPLPGDVEVEPAKPVAFSLSDDKNVYLPSVRVWVRGELIFNGTEFTAAYEESTYSVNAYNGFDFVVVPSGSAQWQAAERVNVRVYCQDTSGLSADTEWFFIGGGFQFPFSTYRFLLRSIRTMDERSPGTLQKMLQGDGGIDTIWKAMLYDPATDLNTLFDPYNIDAQWLPWLKSLVGFTRDFSFEATETELRGIIANAVALWSNKPTDSAYQNAIRMVTGNRFKIRDYFDLHMQTGVTAVTELLEDFDPNVLEFPALTPSGSDLRFCYSSGVYPCTHTFFIHDLPDPPYPSGLFNSTDQARYLQILDWPDDQAFKGTYRIDQLHPGTFSGLLDGTGPAGPNSDKIGSWRLLGTMSEYVTEIRVVDELAGTGILNRELMAYLLDLVRPTSERLDIIYLHFLDEFTFKNDDAQWSLLTGATPSLPDPGGEYYVPATANLITASNLTAQWQEQSTAWKMLGESTSTVVKLKFQYQNVSNFYFVECDYSAKTIKLFKRVANVDTQLGSTIYLPTMLPGHYDVFRVDVERVLSDRLLRVKWNGELYIEAYDAPAAFTLGNIGMEVTGDGARFSLVEVLPVPATIERIGPTP